MTRVEKVSGSGNAFYLRVTERVQGYLQTFLDSREEVAGLTGPSGRVRGLLGERQRPPSVSILPRDEMPALPPFPWSKDIHGGLGIRIVML
jgi:hypothetical protein